MSFRHKRDWQAMALLGAVLLPIYIIASCSPTSAQTLTGNYLHTMCNGNKSIASGYVTGVVDALISLGESRICFPPGSVVGQNVDIVCKGLSENPEYRNVDASLLTHVFLGEAFPCS